MTDDVNVRAAVGQHYHRNGLAVGAAVGRGIITTIFSMKGLPARWSYAAAAGTVELLNEYNGLWAAAGDKRGLLGRFARTIVPALVAELCAAAVNQYLPSTAQIPPALAAVGSDVLFAVAQTVVSTCAMP